MDSADDGRVSINEVQMLLGEKEVLIYALKRQLQVALVRIAELEKKPDVQPELQAVR